jgi:hypothetical protein
MHMCFAVPLWELVAREPFVLVGWMRRIVSMLSGALVVDCIVWQRTQASLDSWFQESVV